MKWFNIICFDYHEEIEAQVSFELQADDIKAALEKATSLLSDKGRVVTIEEVAEED